MRITRMKFNYRLIRADSRDSLATLAPLLYVVPVVPLWFNSSPHLRDRGVVPYKRGYSNCSTPKLSGPGRSLAGPTQD